MNERAAEYLIFTAGGIDCMIAVSSVREVARALPFAPVPAAPYGVAGIVNLRGHALPALDMACLLETEAASAPAINIIADASETFYSLLVENCGDVVMFPPEELTPLPATAPKWNLAAQKICRHQNRIMPVIDIKWLIGKIAAAAQGQGNVP
jgi:chemotaxis signal transduction protein